MPGLTSKFVVEDDGLDTDAGAASRVRRLATENALTTFVKALRADAEEGNCALFVSFHVLCTDSGANFS